MLTYTETMAYGANQYADILTMLEDAGLPAEFTQTGGMCAAIEVQLETGRTLLITDAEDTLCWERSEHRGWGVGLYEPAEDRDGAIAFLDTTDGSPDGLVALLKQILKARPSLRA